MGTSVWILVFTFAFPSGDFGGGMAGVFPTETTCQADMSTKTQAIMAEYQFDQDNFPTLALHCVQQPLPTDSTQPANTPQS